MVENSPTNAAEAFPTSAATEPTAPRTRNGSVSAVPEFVRRRTMSLLQADFPRGMSGMTGIAAGRAPTLTEVRQGAFVADENERRQQFTTGETPEGFYSRRGTLTQARNGPEPLSVIPSKTEETPTTGAPVLTSLSDTEAPIERVETAADKTEEDVVPNKLVSHPTVYDLQRTESGTFPNGYKFPPKHTWKEATVLGFKAFLNFTFRSWVGFLIVFYSVQVVGWGGMIFLLLCTAADPRMCWLQRPPGSGNWVTDCSSKHTSKSLWIEIDAQVLTALFCVTAFGLAPWRCRDLWYLMQYRIWHEHLGLRRLAAVHKGWFRLPGSQHLDPSLNPAELVAGRDDEAIQLLPYPLEKAPPPPWTAIRALPTKLWKMDYVVWLMFMNTIFQIPLCGIMWGMNRFTRPSWATALLIVLGMLSGIAAGWVQFQESKKIKQREGVPVEAVAQEKGFELEQREKENEKAHETV